MPVSDIDMMIYSVTNENLAEKNKVMSMNREDVYTFYYITKIRQLNKMIYDLEELKKNDRNG